MSEQAPRSNSRLDNFEANKAAHEQAQYEDALYGEAGVTDFSDEAKNRIHEADAYEQHLESMAARGDDYDGTVANLENADYKDGIDRQIAADPKLRRMEAMAQSIASAYATEVTPENADRLPVVIKDKEDKLQELLIAFSDASDIDPADKDEIIKRIINMSEQSGAESTETTSVPADDEADEPEVEPGVETPRSERPPEGSPALEGESLEDYERRNRVNPNLAIDPNEMPIAIPEMPGGNPEIEQELEFTVGDMVRVRRTSGELEDDWEVRSIVEADGVTKIDAIKMTEEGLISKLIDIDDLRAMQSIEASNDDEQSEVESEEDDETGPDDSAEVDDDTDDSEAGPDGRARSWFNRAKAAVNGGLTKLYFGIGRTMNKLASNERKDGETDDEYNERMKRNGRRAAVGIAAVAAAYGAYRLYNGIDSGSGGAGSPTLEQPFDPSVDPGDLGPDTQNGTGDTGNAELLNSDAWNIPKGSGGEALMDRIGVDKSVWYEHQNEFLERFPNDAYRMADGNVGFDDPGRLSTGAIEFWAQYSGK